MVSVSSLGFVTITISGMTDQRWVATTDALSSMLGFSESEAVSGGSLVSTSPHELGWYPGALTHNHSLTRGAGLVSGAFWLPQDTSVRQWAGSGKQHTVKTARLLRRRPVRFDIVSKEEVEDLTRGVAALWDEHLTRRLWWYLDRTTGAVGSYGTLGNPWTDVDSGVSYWIVTLAERPDVLEVSPSRSRFQVDLVLNGLAS